MRAGELVGGRFAIERTAGEGGMGLVFLAVDREDGQPVALKVHHGGKRQEPRFAAEAGMARRLRHPRLARFVADGTTAEGDHFLAIEWLEGCDLAARLRQGPLTVAETVELGAQLADVLAYLHGEGVVHRDLKPSNVFLVGGRTDDFRLLDFGVARQLDASMTAAGELLGTPAYMAPEQARGEFAVDGRADLFSLGCLLFECLTGRPTFQGTNPVAVLAKVLWEPAPRLIGLRHDVDAELDALIASLLAKILENRPSSAAEVAARLRRWHFDADAPPLPAGPAELTSAESRLVSVVLAAPHRLLDHQALDTAMVADTTVSDDIVGSPLLRRLDELLALVKPYGGDLQPLANGALVVTIRGAGVATDRALLAARCGLALARALADMVPLGERTAIALATGRAEVSGRLPVGAVIDRAAKLLRLAVTADAAAVRPGVRVDEVTAGLLDARFDLEVADDGFVLHRELSHHGLLRPVLGRPSPLVGRDRELDLLLSTCRTARDEREARAVVLTSPPGGGKSRLLAELLGRLAEGSAGGGFEIWRGHGDPVAVGTPYGLLGTALRHAIAWHDDEGPRERHARLRARLARHLDGEALARVAAFVGESLGIAAEGDDAQLRAARRDAGRMNDWIRAAWQELLDAESREHPLILLLEDLQWGDLPSVQILDQALERLWDRPLVVIGAARPEALRLFPHLWGDRAATTLQLSGLSRRAADQLLRALLGEELAAGAAGSARLAELAQRGGGNPFFLEELARATREPSAGGAPAALPETVLAMIQVRAETLEPVQRRALRAASLFGPACWRGGVASLLGEGGLAASGGGGSPSPAAALDELVKLEILELREPSRFAGDREYAFRHALFREAAYASLTPADRLLGHRLVGLWLEKAGEPAPLELAEHFDHGDRPDLAAPYFAAAAEQALQGHDVKAALELSARGLRHVRLAEIRGRLELLAAEAHRWRGELAETQRLARLASSHLPAGGAAYFRALGEALVAASRRGDRGAADELLVLVREASSDERSRSAHLFCLALAARQVFHLGLYPEAEELVALAGRLAELPGLESWALAELHRLRGAQARHRGDLAGDLAGYTAALRAFEDDGDLRSAANTRVSLGFTYLELGQVEAGESLLLGARADAEKLGLGHVVTRAEQNLGLARHLAGDLAGALALLNKALEAAIRGDDRRMEGWTRIYLANTHRKRGDAETAIAEAEKAAELLRPAPPARAGAQAALARALTRAGRPAEAKLPAAEALAVLHDHGGIEEFESLVWLAWIETLDTLHETAPALAAARQARQRLRLRAHAISDPQHRRTFLDHVPENAALEKLLATLGC